MSLAKYLAGAVTAACAVAGSGYPARASTITFAGEQANTGASFRTASASNSFAGTSSRYYGTDGYELFNTTATGTASGKNGANVGTNIFATPAYVSGSSGVTLVQNNGASGYGYPSVDNPQTVPAGGTPTTVESGTLGQNGGTLFSFVLTGTPPPTVRIGLLVDNIGATYNSSTLSVSSSSGATLSQTEAAGNAVPDLYFFDLKGAVAGETISVGGTVGGAGTTGLNEIAGVTFDSVPEPASMGLLALSSLALLSRRRR